MTSLKCVTALGLGLALGMIAAPTASSGALEQAGSLALPTSPALAW